MVRFIFDLDGTITKQETLPLIADYFNIKEELLEITQQSVQGNIPYIESFIKRVFILGKYPVDEIASLLANVELQHAVCQFIQRHKEYCTIATSNINHWVAPLLNAIGVHYYCSEGLEENNNITKIQRILKKEDIVAQYQTQGDTVVFIGDGNNDVEAMRKANISIACGLIHQPATSVLRIADYLVYTEEALCRLLYQLL